MNSLLCIGAMVSGQPNLPCLAPEIRRALSHTALRTDPDRSSFHFLPTGAAQATVHAWSPATHALLPPAVSKRFGDHYFARAMRTTAALADAQPGRSALEHVEAVLFLARYATLRFPNVTLPLMRVAVKIAREMELFKESPVMRSDDVSESEQSVSDEVRRRTGWSVYLYDRQSSLIDDRMPLIEESEFSLRPATLNIKWEGYLGTSPNAAFTTIVNMPGLYQILSNFLETRKHAVVSGFDPSNPAAFPGYNLFVQRLAEWRFELVATYSNPTWSNPSFRRISLLYDLIGLTISSPLTLTLGVSPPQWLNSLAFHNAVAHARGVTDLLRLSETASYHSSCLEMTAIYRAGLVHVARIRGRLEDLVQVVEDLDIHIAHLTQLESFWVRNEQNVTHLLAEKNHALQILYQQSPNGASNTTYLNTHA
ncbi:hypothetical protein HDU93_006951 [Gonapodya sp. JEL0774]|nr:hypothetical protein HDU93_006951 [Gonapodya sp. JEL0774]